MGVVWKKVGVVYKVPHIMNRSYVVLLLLTTIRIVKLLNLPEGVG